MFHCLSKLLHLRNLLGKQFHNAYNQYNLPLLEQMQFVLLYNHPKVPFLKRHMDKHEHTVYNQYKYYKFWLNETSY